MLGLMSKGQGLMILFCMWLSRAAMSSQVRGDKLSIKLHRLPSQTSQYPLQVGPVLSFLCGLSGFVHDCYRMYGYAYQQA